MATRLQNWNETELFHVIASDGPEGRVSKPLSSDCLRAGNSRLAALRHICLSGGVTSRACDRPGALSTSLTPNCAHLIDNYWIIIGNRHAYYGLNEAIPI